MNLHFVKIAPFLILLISFTAKSSTLITVGSKPFTESYVLAEIFSQVFENNGHEAVEVIRKQGLGGTGLIYEALYSGHIDLYPEYTGTIAEAILKEPLITDPGKMKVQLQKLGLVMSEPLGFNNTYALAVKRTFAEKNHLKTVSDLKKL